MKITKKTVEIVNIRRKNDMDFVSFILNDTTDGEGEIVIYTHEKAWRRYFGCMGVNTNLRKYLLESSIPYLVEEIMGSHPIYMEYTYYARIIREIRNVLRRVPKSISISL